MAMNSYFGKGGVLLYHLYRLCVPIKYVVLWTRKTIWATVDWGISRAMDVKTDWTTQANGGGAEWAISCYCFYIVIFMPIRTTVYFQHFLLFRAEWCSFLREKEGWRKKAGKPGMKWTWRRGKMIHWDMCVSAWKHGVSMAGPGLPSLGRMWCLVLLPSLTVVLLSGDPEQEQAMRMLDWLAILHQRWVCTWNPGGALFSMGPPRLAQIRQLVTGAWLI